MSNSSSARSDFESSLQHTSFAPKRYPLGEPDERVTYTPVLGEDGVAIGAVYVSASGGLSTLFYANSGETMTSLMHQLTGLYSQGLSAAEAYERLTSVNGVTYGEEDADSLSTLFNPPTPTVAAAEPAAEVEGSVDLPSGPAQALPEGSSLYVTEDDGGTVLDLVYSDSTDVYLRGADSTWAPVTGDGTAQDPIDGRVIVDVALSYVRAYDSARAADDTITDTDIEQYRASAA